MKRAATPSLTFAFFRLMLCWLVAIEVLLIIAVFVAFAWGLKWDFSSSFPGAMVAVSELQEKIRVAPNGDVALGDSPVLERFEQENPDFWFRVIGPRNEIRSGLADGPYAVPPIKLGDNGTVMRLDKVNNSAVVWSGDGKMLVGASGAVTGWGDLIRFFWLAMSSYIVPLLALPLVVGALLIAVSIKPIRTRLMSLRPPKAPDLVHGQRLSTSEMPAELAGFVENYNAALDYIGTAMERLDSLSGDVAHEFRTPLNRMWAQADKLPLGSARDTIKSELRTLSDTLNALLNLAKSDLEAAPHELVELSALTQSIVQDIAPAAFRAGREISFEGTGHCYSNTNAALAGIVIRNLIENAIRHTRVHDRIDVSVVECEIAVADSGSGLSPAAGKSNRGIGLKLTARIAAHLNAKVTFGETPGGGLTVTVKF